MVIDDHRGHDLGFYHIVVFCTVREKSTEISVQNHDHIPHCKTNLMCDTTFTRTTALISGTNMTASQVNGSPRNDIVLDRFIQITKGRWT